ncbi:hypothetical protein I118_1210 [Bifidobacterium longum D2957]|nr:hypothetical protein I118_1210 [Bifidobacterium longum D2957]
MTAGYAGRPRTACRLAPAGMRGGGETHGMCPGTHTRPHVRR